MFTRLDFTLAIRYLLSKRKDSFISVITVFSLTGILLGVATLITVMSVMNGFRQELLTKILGANPHIALYPLSGTFDNYEAELQKIGEISKDVLYSIPVIEEQVMLITDQGSRGLAVKGMRSEDVNKKAIIFDNIVEGKLWSNDDDIILGANLQYSLGLNVGDWVKLVSPELNQTIMGSIPRTKTYRVAGFFESGMYEYDSLYAFIPLQAAQTHFLQGKGVNMIEIFVKEPQDATLIANQIETAYYSNNTNLRAIDWQQANSSFISALNVERNVMFLILVLIIIVAAFNIISALTMLVKDKRRNIAILRAMGVTRHQVVRIFFICGSLVGTVGTSLGVIFGLLFVRYINVIKQFIERMFHVSLFDPSVYMFYELPTVVRVEDVVMIAIIALGLSFLATIYPAHKASITNVADILRYE